MSRPHPSACRSRADVATSPTPNRMRPHPRAIPPIPFPVSALCCAAAVTTASALMGRGRSLWFDEQYSLILASKPVPELIRLTAVDAHPPLYYLMLKSWMPLAQGNIDILRTFNCLLLGAAVLTLIVMLRDLLGERVACLCMPLSLCGGFMLRYGYELRMYATAMLLATLGTYALVHAAGVTAIRRAGQPRPGPGPGPTVPPPESRRPSATLGWWAAYAVIVALGMLTLYLTAFVWFTHAVWLTVRSVKAVRRDESRGTQADGTWHAWRWMLAYVASILLFLPWMPAAIGQVRGSSSVLPPVTRRMNMSGVANAFDVMLLGMTEDEIPAPASLTVGAIVLAAIGSLVAAYTACMCTPRWTDAGNEAAPGNREDRANDMDRMSAMTLIVMLFVVPTTLLILWSAIQETANGGYGMFSVRYLSVVAPFLYATLGVSFAMPLTEGRASPAQSPSSSPGIAVPRRTTAFRHLTGITYVVTLVTLLAGAIVFGVRGNHSFDRDDTPGSAALSRQVECSEAHPVVAQDEYTYIDAYWYYRDCPAYRFLDADDVPAHGGYAPLHGSAAQLRSLDDLDATGFTLLSWSTTRDYDRLLGSDQWTRTGILKYDANAAITYREYQKFPDQRPPAKFN